MPEPKSADTELSTTASGTKTEDTALSTNDGGAETEASTSIPAGVIPLFFSGAGQQLFKCVVEEHLTNESPHKLIPKERILEDFKNRAAVSDFHPVKKKIQEYPGEEILLVYDYDFKYGENFYVCTTEGAKELILNPPEAEKGDAEKGIIEEEEDEIPKTPEPKEWVCLGSDLEIMEGHFQDTRPLVQVSLSRKRRHFESPCVFTSSLATAHPESCADIISQEDPNFSLHRMEMEKGVQAISEKTESHSQTQWLRPCNKSIQYISRELLEAEKEDISCDSGIQEFLNKVYPRVEASLQQNLIMNMLLDDYKNLSDTDGITEKKSDTNMKEYQSFADLQFSKNKVITWVEWHPTVKGIVAVSCGENLSFDDRVDLSTVLLRKQSLILIWSFTDPIHPVLFLEAPDSILCFRFNPSNPNLIVGGCVNGQVVLWNIEKYQDRILVNKNTEPVESRSMTANMAIFDTDPKLDHAPMVQHCVIASIKEGHSRDISNIQWIPHNIEICQKTGGVLDNPSHECNQIISCSIDGMVMVWDIRPPVQKIVSRTDQKKIDDPDSPYSYLDLTWRPFIKVPLPRADNPGKYSATRISIREKHTEIPKTDENVNKGIGIGNLIEDANTMFYVGTEDGEVVYCNWKPTRDSESGKLVAPTPSYHFNAHSGPVCCMERSPFFKDILLSVGYCTWAIWKEKVETGFLLSSSSSSVPFTGGAWSPTRPGVFFIIKRNGNVDVWDLMDRSHEALLTQNISSFSLTSIVPWQLTSKQLMLAVGDSAGTLHILETPWNLSHSSHTEIPIMEMFLQREVKRLAFTSDRMAKRVVEKKALDAEKQDPQVKETEVITELFDERAKKDYDNYLSMELKLLIQLGIMHHGGDSDNN